MAASEMTVKVKTERDGKLLIVSTENGLKTIIDLQEHLHLTDEQTAELVAKLDERDAKGGE